MALGGQVQPMLDEPEQGLPDTAEFGHLVEDEDDGFLDAAIGILLEPVADLHEADRGSDDKFAAPGLLIAGRQRTVAQKIELILVEAALQSQQQPVVALTRRIDRLLIDQHGITPRHISISCCQSRLLRAKRETSRAATAPTLPRQTSATIRSKPARATPPAAERPRSSSTVSMRAQPSAVRRSRIAYCKALLSRLWRT